MVTAAMEPKIEEVAVIDAIYKKGKSRQSQNEYFRVAYTTFNGTFAHYFHPGSRHDVARERFERYWWLCLSKKSGRPSEYDYPQTIHDAVERAPDELSRPSTISIDFNSKHHDVIAISFDTNENERPF
jgi:hypothetical protein